MLNVLLEEHIEYVRFAEPDAAIAFAEKLIKVSNELKDGTAASGAGE